jgi:pilus assembly protein Flp/PilA
MLSSIARERATPPFPLLMGNFCLGECPMLRRCAPRRQSFAVLPQLKAFLQEESATTAIEYSLIAGGIALAIIAVVMSIGPKLNTTFSSISSQLK